MPYPVIQKTWQFQVNQVVDTQGPAGGDPVVMTQFHELFRVIKNLLKSFPLNPWTCSGSSDARSGALGSAGMDSVDRWTSAAVMEGAAGGSRHGWIVLRQTMIAVNYEICIDLAAASSSTLTVVVSPSAGFTGGSVTARPTATDEIVVCNNNTAWSNIAMQHVVHAMMSSDGQCTRVSVQHGFEAGAVVTSQCTFFLADVPQDQVTGWTNPSVTCFRGTNLDATDPSAVLAPSTAQTVGRANNTSMALAWTEESNGSTVLSDKDSIGNIPNDIDTSYALFGIGIDSVTLGGRGRHCSLFDIWWRPIGIAINNNFPDVETTRKFISLGRIILPWKNDGTVPLFAS